MAAKKKIKKVASKSFAAGKKAMKSGVVTQVIGAGTGGLAPAFLSGILPSSVPKNMVMAGIAAVEFFAMKNPKFRPFAQAAFCGTVGALVLGIKANGLMGAPRLSPAQLDLLRRGTRVNRSPHLLGRPSEVMGRPSTVMAYPNTDSRNRAW